MKNDIWDPNLNIGWLGTTSSPHDTSVDWDDKDISQIINDPSVTKE